MAPREALSFPSLSPADGEAEDIEGTEFIRKF